MKSLLRLKQLGFAWNLRICNPNRIRTPIYPCKSPYSSSISPSSSTVSHPYRFFSSTSVNGCSEALSTSLPRIETQEYFTESGFNFHIYDLPGNSDEILLRRECSGDTIQVSTTFDLRINIIKKDGRCLEIFCNTYGLKRIHILTMLMKRLKADEIFSSMQDYYEAEHTPFLTFYQNRDSWLGYDEDWPWDEHLENYLEARGVDSSMLMLIRNYKKHKDYLNGKHVNEIPEYNNVSTRANITSTKNLKYVDACLKIAARDEIKRVKSGEAINERLVECDPNYVCPFEIVDKPGKNIAMFKREVDGDSILVEAGEIGYKRNPVTIMITKKDGTRLRYRADLYYGSFSKHGILWIEKPEGWCNAADAEGGSGELTESMFRILERAEINESFWHFIHNYTLKRLNREYIRLVRKVKRFV